MCEVQILLETILKYENQTKHDFTLNNIGSRSILTNTTPSDAFDGILKKYVFYVVIAVALLSVLLLSFMVFPIIL